MQLRPDRRRRACASSVRASSHRACRSDTRADATTAIELVAYPARWLSSASECASSANVSAAALSSRAAAITDDVVEQVTRLVLERLTDHAIRETVGDIVSRVAEQLVREEIAKIKSALRQDARGDMANG